MKHLGKTQPFNGPDGSILPDSIAEVRYLRLGGVDQWVMLRGESISNPPLMLLHGGPGMPESGLFRRFTSPLEKHFTLVYWDQRGAGKSFSRSIPRASMTVERFLADLDELVEYVRRRLSKDKLVLYGHSWGSALGVLYAARFPAKVAAYVGSGQIGDAAAAESASYAFGLAEAERRHDRKALRKLKAIGPPPYGPGELFTERMMERTMWVDLVFLGGFAGALAFSIVYNDARIALSERARELATLRVIGFTRAEVARLLFAGLALEVLAGLPIGALLGAFLGRVLAPFFENENVRFTIPTTARNLAESSLFIVGAAMLSAAAVNWRVGKLDLISVLKTRE